MYPTPARWLVLILLGVAVGCTVQQEQARMDAYLAQADSAFQQGQYADAARAYNAAYEAAGKVETDGCARHYRVLVGLGEAYAQMDSSRQAVQAYLRAVSLNPDCPPARAGLGQIYEKQGRLEEALDHTLRAAKAAPDSIAYQYAAGSLLLRTGSPAEAVEYFEDVLAQRPRHDGALYSLGQAVTQLGQRQQAAHYFARLDSIRRERDAIRTLQKEARRNKRDPMGWLRLGQALERSGRLEEAIQSYQVASSLAPQNIALQNNIANLMLRSGDTDGAIDRYQTILERDSTASDVWLNLGVAYANSGRFEKARQVWNRLLQLTPDHPEARAYLNRLDSLQHADGAARP